MQGVSVHNVYGGQGVKESFNFPWLEEITLLYCTQSQYIMYKCQVGVEEMPKNKVMHVNASLAMTVDMEMLAAKEVRKMYVSMFASTFAQWLAKNRLQEENSLCSDFDMAYLDQIYSRNLEENWSTFPATMSFYFPQKIAEVSIMQIILSGDVESNPGPSSFSTGIEAEQSFQVSNESKSINYYQQVSACKEEVFHATWGGCVIKNCKNEGELLEFKSKSDYDSYFKDTKKQLWLYMSLKVFRFDDTKLFGVYCCPECVIMSGTLGLQVDQDPEVIAQRLCLHSQVASSVLEDWRQVWDITLPTDVEVFSVLYNKDTTCELFITSESNKGSLSAVFHNRKICLLFCVTPRQEVPICSNCVRRKCVHVTILTNYQKSRDNAEIDTENDRFHVNPDIEEEEFGYDDNYLTILPNHIRGYLYGYNYNPIIYPFRDSPEQQRVWFERMQGTVNIPETLVPIFDLDRRCKHNLQFNNEDESLVKESLNLCLFTELGDRIFPSTVMLRPSVGPCNCRQRYDGHSLLIWNLGKGKFVDYTVLHSYLHRWRTCGMSIMALHRSIVDGAESCGISCSLTYTDLHRSVCGFFSNFEFNLEKAFSCPTNHGSSPKWIVSDGKSLGPLKRKVKHLHELDIAVDDKNVLTQSTKFRDRIFIKEKKERVLVCKLVTGLLPPKTLVDEFLSSQDIKSENGLLLRNLVRHIGQKFAQQIPFSYVSFLSNVSKNSSARSLLQTNIREPLDYLFQFCQEDLDLRVIEKEKEYKLQ